MNRSSNFSGNLPSQNKKGERALQKNHLSGQRARSPLNVNITESLFRTSEYNKKKNRVPKLKRAGKRPMDLISRYQMITGKTISYRTEKKNQKSKKKGKQNQIDQIVKIRNSNRQPKTKKRQSAKQTFKSIQKKTNSKTRKSSANIQLINQNMMRNSKMKNSFGGHSKRPESVNPKNYSGLTSKKSRNVFHSNKFENARTYNSRNFITMKRSKSMIQGQKSISFLCFLG